MNNEPVAWMIIDVDNGKSLQFKENKFSEINIPLYTAPRELSADDIHEVAKQFLETHEREEEVFTAIEDWYGFARAILKKASDI